MLACPDVHEIMMLEAKCLGLQKAPTKTVVFNYLPHKPYEMVHEEWLAGSIRCKAFITTDATAMCKGRSIINAFLPIALGVQTGDVLEMRTNYLFNGSACSSSCSCAPVRPPP